MFINYTLICFFNLLMLIKPKSFKKVISILFLMSYIRPLEIILAKKKTELLLLFHKNTTKLVFLWPNMGQNSIKVLNKFQCDCIPISMYEVQVIN